MSSLSESFIRPFPTPAVTCSKLYYFRVVRLVNVDSLTGILVKLGASYKILYDKLNVNIFCSNYDFLNYHSIAPDVSRSGPLGASLCINLNVSPDLGHASFFPNVNSDFYVDFDAIY